MGKIGQVSLMVVLIKSKFLFFIMKIHNLCVINAVLQFSSYYMNYFENSAIDQSDLSTPQNQYQIEQLTDKRACTLKLL